MRVLVVATLAALAGGCTGANVPAPSPQPVEVVRPDPDARAKLRLRLPDAHVLGLPGSAATTPAPAAAADPFRRAALARPPRVQKLPAPHKVVIR